MLRTWCALALLLTPAFSADVELFNHKNLDGWEVIGDGVWHVLSDGTLMGERDLRPVLRDAPFLHPDGVKYRDWLNVQSWLYTRRNDFAQFDLAVEYWVRAGGNSGISIRDPSRAQYAIATPVDYKKTRRRSGTRSRSTTVSRTRIRRAAFTGSRMPRATFSRRTTGTRWRSSRARLGFG